MQQPWVYFFGDGRADAGAGLKHLVGGKGASLAEMTKAQLPVPPGFTISAEACAYHERHRRWPDGLEAEVRANLARLETLARRPFGAGDRPLLVAVRSGAAQSMPGMMDTVLNVGLNPDCVSALAARTGDARAAWEAYLHFLVMFARTVGNLDESRLAAVVPERTADLDAAQLEALCGQVADLWPDLPTDPWEQLVAAINAVFASWHSERAVTYRRHHRIDNLPGTAVNVQVMCPSEVSGVLFTANPVNPALEQMILEASFGLGEAVVLGKVTPDHFVLDRRTLEIVERVIARKDRFVASLAEDAAPRTDSDAPSLTDTQVRELAELGRRIETYFGHPCDIEWGLSQGQLFLLQSRPIQVKGAAAIDPAERERVRQEEIAALQELAAPDGTVWSRFNLYEILPEPTPLTWAIVRRFMSGQGGYGLMYRDLGFDPDPALDEIGVFDLVCGRPYCNLSREPRLQYRTLPFEHPFDLLKKHPQRALYPQSAPNWARAGWKFWLFLPLVFVKLWRSGVKLKQISRTFAEQYEQQIAPAFLAEVERAEREDWGKKTDRELLDLLEHWTRRTLIDFARDSLKPTALAGITLGNLERALAQRLQPPGQEGPTEEGELPGLKKAQEALRKLVMGVHPAEDADLPGALRALRAGRLTKDEFLRRFGHRGSQEMELSRPRWSEDHATLDRLAALPGAATGETSHDGQQVWEQLATEAGLTPEQRPAVEAELHMLQRYLGLRETAKHHLLKGYALIRRVLVELDRRHRLDGDLFFLTPDELPRLVEDDNARQELRDRAAQRRKRRAIALSLPVPQVLFSDDLEAIGRAADVGAADVLQGMPLSAGVAEARAWVLEEVANAPPPDEPYILVCPSTDPAWVPLFVQARGLVMETGGVLSHGAIVAREFGLPAVAGIADVHRRLKTGQRLRVDGATGRVSVLD